MATCSELTSDPELTSLCRTDLLGFYQRRGYRFTFQVPAENSVPEFERLTRPGITLKYFQKHKKI